jgi:tetratricopeptide (TPR) repeat protein
MLALSFLVAAPPGFASTPLDELVSQKKPLTRDNLEHLYQYKLDRGAANWSVASCFLIRASKRLLEAGNIDAARSYAEYAVKLAPEYPPAYTHRALVCWTDDRLRVDKLIEGLAGYLSAALTNYVSLAIPLTKMLFIVLVSVLFTITAFAIVSLYKYFKLFAHDLGHMLPAPIPRYFSVCCALLALALPLFLQWSIIIAAFFWLFLLFLYHSRKEQQLIIIFTLFFVLSPVLIRVLSQLITTNASETFYHVYQVNDQNWDEETALSLERRVNENPYDTESLFALALMSKREGRIMEAQRLYSKLLELDPLDCRSWCNLGNTYLAAKNHDSARAHYNRSIELCPESVEAHYNLSRVLLLEYIFAESNKYFNAAKALNAELVDRFLQNYSENSNRMVVDQTFSAGAIWQKTFSSSEATERLSADLWDYFFSGFSYHYRYAVIIVFLLFVGLLFIDPQTYNYSLACEYCGCSICRKCKRLVVEYRLCKECAGIFKRTRDIMNSVSMRESQVASVERFQGRKIFIGKLLSVLLPGSGHLVFDHPFRGTALLFVFFILVAKMLFWNMLLVNPWQMISGSAYFDIVFVAVSLSILYLYAFGHFNFSSLKLFQFLSLIRVTRRELQIKE